MSVNDISIIHNGRDVVFNVLSRVFLDIPDEASNKLISETLDYILTLADSSENEDLKAGAEILRELRAEGADWLDKNTLEYAKDFTSLFILGRGSVSVYESVYRSPEKLIKQEPWNEVKRIYAEHGLKKIENNKTIEDHVALELQFMAFLSKHIAQAIEKECFDTAEAKIRVQKDFHDNHLSLWIPELCTKVIQRNGKLNSSYYPAFALILKGFLEEDRAFLEELIGA